jgi:glycerate kinase
MPAVIPETVLLLVEDFPRLGAERVRGALRRGLDPRPVRVLPLGEAVDDATLRSARAVVLAAARLDDRTLAGSAAFEIATRARQAGVPAYAVTAENALDAFEARIVDLQVVLEARTPRALSAAATKLAQIV